MSDDRPAPGGHIPVSLDDNVLSTFCAQEHDIREIELRRLAGTRWRVGDCPLCPRRYESRISGMGWGKP